VGSRLLRPEILPALTNSGGDRANGSGPQLKILLPMVQSSPTLNRFLSRGCIPGTIVRMR